MKSGFKLRAGYDGAHMASYNILVTGKVFSPKLSCERKGKVFSPSASSPKTTKNEVTKMGWNAQKSECSIIL